MNQSTEQPFYYRAQAVLTLRQIDRLNQVVKGTAFRAFKRTEAELTEGRDFFVLSMAASSDDSLEPMPDALRAELEAADALYASSQVTILLTQNAYARVQHAANLSPS